MKNSREIILTTILFILFPIATFCTDISSYHFNIYHDTLNKKLKINLSIDLSNKDELYIFLFSDYAHINKLSINGKQIAFNHKNDTLTFQYKNSKDLSLQISYELPVDSFETKSKAIILRRENKWYPVIYNKLFDCEININDLSEYYIISSGDKTEHSKDMHFTCKNLQTIPLIILDKNYFKKVSEGKLNFYSEKLDTVNRDKLNELFKESFAFYVNFFNKRPFDGDFDIIEIPEMDFYLAQSLRNIVIYGKPFLFMFLNNNYNWITHEVAHQWWGLSLFFDYDKKNYWFIAEAINEYLKVIYIEKQHSDSTVNDLINTCIGNINNYITPENDIPISDITDVFSQNTGMLMYQKGPLICYCLSEKIGKDKLSEILKRFYLENINKITDYQMLINNLLSSTDDNTIKFFGQIMSSKGLNMINENIK